LTSGAEENRPYPGISRAVLLRLWSVLTDLKTRGVKDVFIACRPGAQHCTPSYPDKTDHASSLLVNGLKGFPEAIETAFPQAMVQLCIVHIGRYDCPKNHARTMVLVDTTV